MSKTPQFTIGQRWANTAEPELGIGIITHTDTRMITMYFPDSESTRTFAKESAPLVRVEFRPGESVENLEGVGFTITSAKEQQGLLFYNLENDEGEHFTLPETQVVGNSAMAGPLERLLHGQTDRYKAFSLRYQSWEHYRNYLQSPLRGLMGPRVNLIAHQFHIGNTVSQLWQPRVMLADEVGLGKTIEAGLITHKLLTTQQIQRVLILVPDPLVNQWLVEMMRRFNMPVRVFNETQCQAICDSDGIDNPFEAEQLVLCSIEFLLDNAKWREQSLACDWDLLIVDEAHHLKWSPDSEADPSYALVEQFSTRADGLLLLTATPEKEGHQSHFAQLRLLDPSRYHDLDQFVAQQLQFENVATIAEKLMGGESLESNELDSLKALLNDETSQALIHSLNTEAEGNGSDRDQNQALATRLLDRQGTGRVLYRNTRASITDFPIRQLHQYPLELPESYQNSTHGDAHGQLYPESAAFESGNDEWLDHDPRVEWLANFLKKNRTKKILTICHHKQTAIALEQYLTLRKGVLCAAFHEDLSIIERDRAAAWFAENESGAHTLICSEIGSEGRNFQFCHHLVLFDLPTPVDLLEQRIGRLDRIGQVEDIQIHSLFFLGTLQERLYRWYHQGLNAFEKTSSTSSVVYSRLQQQFFDIDNDTDLEPFIETSKALFHELNTQFMHGRNRLLELHSQGNDAADTILAGLDDLDWDDTLSHYMDRLYAQHGVETEELSPLVLLARPGTDMESHFPGVADEGTSITFDRATALARDDIKYYTWDHPDVRAAQDMVLTGEKGKACVCLLKNKQLKEGTLLFELIFVIHCPAPEYLGVNQFLPSTPVRVLLDQQGRNLSSAVSLETLDKQAKNVKGELVAAVIKNYRKDIEASVAKGTQIAETQFQSLQTSALENFQQHLNTEIERNVALATTNPAIKPEETEHLRGILQQGSDALTQNARVYLDGIRVMVTVQS